MQVRCTKCGKFVLDDDDDGIGVWLSPDAPFRPPGNLSVERDGCVFCEGGDAPCARCGERQLIPITDKTERRYLVGQVSDERRVYRCLKCGQPHKGRKSDDSLDTAKQPPVGGGSEPPSGGQRGLF